MVAAAETAPTTTGDQNLPISFAAAEGEETTVTTMETGGTEAMEEVTAVVTAAEAAVGAEVEAEAEVVEEAATVTVGTGAGMATGETMGMEAVMETRMSRMPASWTGKAFSAR